MSSALFSHSIPLQMQTEISRSLRSLSNELEKFRDGPLKAVVETMLANIESQQRLGVKALEKIAQPIPSNFSPR